MNILFMIPVVMPAVFGIPLVISSFIDHRKVTLETGGKVNIPEEGNLARLHAYVMTIMAISMAAAMYFAWIDDHEVSIIPFLRNLPICFRVDSLGRYFATIITIVWILVGFYSITYMKHEGEEKKFFGFYMTLYSVLISQDYAGNLTTMYLFYELMTLTSMPMVLHSGSRESIMAALKYLFYSMCGAYMGLFGIFFLYNRCSFDFTPGGYLQAGDGRSTMLMIAIFVMILGFGAKAGMFPLHAWLPAAHPVAPSPASALLSSLIVKCGVFSILRVVYFIVGPDYIRGTWVQYAWMAIALLTVFMGSMMAYLEPVTKKRLAYSTVSQVSYILFGLALLTPTAFVGALLHVAYHAFIKSGLFLCAGTFMYCCHKTQVKDLRGLGRQMPVVLWCWTFFSLALVGIPPFSGFVSKWYLAQGALEAGVGIFAYLGPIVLLISALLTAGYLLPVTMNGFFPGEYHLTESLKERPSKHMLIPLVILAGLSLLLGVLPNPLVNYLTNIAGNLM